MSDERWKLDQNSTKPIYVWYCSADVPFGLFVSYVTPPLPGIHDIPLVNQPLGTLAHIAFNGQTLALQYAVCRTLVRGQCISIRAKEVSGL